MKRNLKKWRFAQLRSLLLLTLVAMLSSCSRNDLPTPQDLIIYMPTGSTANSMDATFVTARGNVLEGSGTAFPVLLTRAFDRDVQVTAAIDTSLLAVYNREHNTETIKIPDGSFILEGNGQVHIPAGQERSADSLRIALGTQAGSLDFTKEYVLPIRLSSSNSDLPLSSNRAVMYVRVRFSQITTQLNGAPANRVIPLRISRTPAGDIVSGNLNLTAAINTRFATPLTIALSDRQDWLASYNQANQTNYIAFPTGTFSLSPNNVSINSGTLSADMPFSLMLSNMHAFETGRSYLLPVGIVDEGPVPPHEAEGRAYFALDIALQNIHPDNPAPSGSRVDRADWTATASSTDTQYAPGGTPAMVFDGNPATGWHSDFGAQNVVFTVDMRNTKNIRGFSFTPRYWNFYNSVFISAITGMEILSSNDGINWTSQGSYAGSMPGGTPSNPELRNLSFYTPVQARYFRFAITQYGQYMPGFGELYAYE
ncbi:BT_3987 domain-containing protein [Sphingobacterium deserti]|uniref:F5/8 type C domain-containing protein n=1 Tax=Sphingobacterium deserti TaxID=1229276 RepID=A0A0B8SZK1_9SPHI|nr:DUF1735 domain-containing protein [Sphingobacterium deserti]KGE12996.1 hypothetical protein DI53_3213 [Sphingobacterium deserti]